MKRWDSVYISIRGRNCTTELYYIECKEQLQGIIQLAFFEIITGETLGKFHWISKVPLQSSGMAAISKIKTDCSKVMVAAIPKNCLQSDSNFLYNVTPASI